MLLEPQTMVRFIGGQAKILNERKGCLYQGEISNITVTEYGLILDFSWLAKNDDLFSDRQCWVLTDRKTHSAHLSFFENQDRKGRVEFKKMPKDQLILFSSVVEEVIVLLPPNYGNPLKKENVAMAKPSAKN